MTDSTPPTFLTHEAFARLTEELEHLSTVGRDEIAKRIELAREEGDLKENGGYHAAKDEQGKQDYRIRSLSKLLREATVGDSPVSDGTVQPGTVVTATIAGVSERFLLGNREISEVTSLEVFSESSPIGEAILGKKVGESASYLAPNGKQITVSIDSVETYTGD